MNSPPPLPRLRRNFDFRWVGVDYFKNFSLIGFCVVLYLYFLSISETCVFNIKTFGVLHMFFLRYAFFEKIFIWVLLGCLLPKMEKTKPSVQLMVSRENLHLVKLLIFLWFRNTPRDTQSVETRNAFHFASVERTQLILAKIGVPPDGKKPVGGTTFKF